MNILLWILQIILGIYFFVTGILHFILPPNLPAQLGWMYDLPSILHYISGAAEILGGLGLVLPGLMRIQTRLTPLAAIGLFLVMLGAMVYHITRGEMQNLVMNIVLAVLLTFVAYMRWRSYPLSNRGELKAD